MPSKKINLRWVTLTNIVLSTKSHTPCESVEEKLIEERKMFLKENSDAFGVSPQLRTRRITVKLSSGAQTVETTGHIAALHVGPAPWSQKEAVSSSIHHGGEEDESPCSPVATSTCTVVCGDNTHGKS